MRKFLLFLSLGLLEAQVVTQGGSKAVPVAGVPVALTSTKLLVRWLVIQVPAANTGIICVGGSDSICASGRGIRITAGQSMALNPVGEPKDSNRYDLSKVFVDSTVSTEGVQFTYAQ